MRQNMQTRTGRVGTSNKTMDWLYRTMPDVYGLILDRLEQMPRRTLQGMLPGAMSDMINRANLKKQMRYTREDMGDYVRSHPFLTATLVAAPVLLLAGLAWRRRAAT